jgi:hypothetical protein
VFKQVPHVTNRPLFSQVASHTARVDKNSSFVDLLYTTSRYTSTLQQAMLSLARRERSTITACDTFTKQHNITIYNDMRMLSRELSAIGIWTLSAAIQ